MQVQWSVAKQHPAQTESIFKVNPFRIQHGQRFHRCGYCSSLTADEQSRCFFRKKLSIWWHASVLSPSQRFFRLEWWSQGTRVGNWTDWSPAASLVWPWNRGLSSTARSGSLTFIYLFFYARGPCCLQCRRFPWRWKSATLIGHTLLEATRRLERPLKGKIRLFFLWQ